MFATGVSIPFISQRSRERKKLRHLLRHLRFCFNPFHLAKEQGTGTFLSQTNSDSWNTVFCLSVFFGFFADRFRPAGLFFKEKNIIIPNSYNFPAYPPVFDPFRKIRFYFLETGSYINIPGRNTFLKKHILYSKSEELNRQRTSGRILRQAEKKQGICPNPLNNIHILISADLAVPDHRYIFYTSGAERINSHAVLIL